MAFMPSGVMSMLPDKDKTDFAIFMNSRSHDTLFAFELLVAEGRADVKCVCV